MSKPKYSTANSDEALNAYKAQLAKYETALAKYEAEAQARTLAAEEEQRRRLAAAEEEQQRRLAAANAEASKYVGDKGYERSVNLAKQGAVAASQGAKNTVESTARTSGMSRAQAAAMGANTMTDAYGNAFNQQQANAYNSGTDAANLAMSGVDKSIAISQWGAGNQNQVSQWGANSQNQIAANALQGQQNQVQNYAAQYDMGSNLDTTKNQIAKAKADRSLGWVSTGLNAVGGVLQGLGGSDARMKDAQKIDYKKTRYTGRTKETKKTVAKK